MDGHPCTSVARRCLSLVEQDGDFDPAFTPPCRHSSRPAPRTSYWGERADRQTQRDRATPPLPGSTAAGGGVFSRYTTAGHISLCESLAIRPHASAEAYRPFGANRRDRQAQGNQAMPRSPSSRQPASSPSSRGGSLARKRTLPTDPVQGTPRINSLGGTIDTSSSPVFSTGDWYRGQSPRRDEAGGDGDAGKLLSSPASVYSSPDMTRSVSAHSIFGPPVHSHQQWSIASSPLARSGSLDVVPTTTRNSPVKRRRSLCEPLPLSSPTMAPRVSPPSFKRWYGREGENVWPPEVDEAFFHGQLYLPVSYKPQTTHSDPRICPAPSVAPSSATRSQEAAHRWKGARP